MAEAVYIVGALITGLCSILLMRAYYRVRQRLLLWSSLCFAGLTVSNVFLFVDLILFPQTISLYVLRLGTAAVAMVLLLYGLIWDGE
jgi:hypothetical protein